MALPEVTKFLPRPSNGNILMSVCTNCFSPLGPATSYRELQITEGAHVCKHIASLPLKNTLGTK